MPHGYIYVLTNPAMPGVVKIGRTDRDPRDRARELRTTGVPSPFEVAHSCLVDDSVSFEAQIHHLLAASGARPLRDREFFAISVDQAVELIQTLAGESAPSSVDFSRRGELSELAAAVKVPLGNEAIGESEANMVSGQLARIGRKGCPWALQQAAFIFEVNYPSAIKFREPWQEFVELKRIEAERHPIPSGGQTLRAELGRDVAEYLYRLNRLRWLVASDYEYVGKFLVSGDRFIYDGFINEVQRSGFPPEVRVHAENL